MRQSRAPTQAQQLNPAAPTSSTKSGRLFGKNNFGNTGHNFRRSAAGAFGPDLAKKLSQLVKMEKNVMRSMELVGRERREVARQLSVWGEECDEDVSDITDKLGVLIYEIGELEDQFIDRYDQYRVTIKSIRNIEASVQPSRDRKAKITDQIAQLKYKDPTSPKIVVLEQELVRAEAESLVAEAQLSNITREKLKTAYQYQFDALQEHCEKVAMIAGYGKHLLELVDDTPVTPGETRVPYDGYDASKSIIQDCEQSLINWVPQRAAVKSRLSQRSRSRSARRASRTRGEGVSLQDRPLTNGSGTGWVPADEHGVRNGHHLDDDDQYEDVNDDDDLYEHRRHDGLGDEHERSQPLAGTTTTTTQDAPANSGGRFYNYNPTVPQDTANITSGTERDNGMTSELGVPVSVNDTEGLAGDRPGVLERSSYERMQGGVGNNEADVIEGYAGKMERAKTPNMRPDSGYDGTGSVQADGHEGPGPLRSMMGKLGLGA